MRINLFGQRGPIGGGRHFGEFCDAMKSLHLVGNSVFEYDYFNSADYRACMDAAGSDDINIHFVNVNALPADMRENSWPTLPGVNIHWAIFEATILDRAHLAWLGKADIVFVPSEWGKDVLIRNGLSADRIDVVPEGVNPTRFHPLMRDSYTNTHDELYRVLVVSKFEERKGFPELLTGYAQAFGGDESARLILKSDNLWMKSLGNNAYEENLAALRGLVTDAGINNAVILDGALSDDDLAHLYNASDVLLFPSRAEGWGLPLIEAMASGLPVATTCYSGHTEFLEPARDKVGLINHRMVPMGERGRAGEWAHADAEDIATCLTKMRGNQEHYRRLAHEASSMMRTQFSWQRAAERCLEALRGRMALFQLSLEI